MNIGLRESARAVLALGIRYGGADQHHGRQEPGDGRLHAGPDRPPRRRPRLHPLTCASGIVGLPAGVSDRNGEGGDSERACRFIPLAAPSTRKESIVDRTMTCLPLALTLALCIPIAPAQAKAAKHPKKAAHRPVAKHQTSNTADANPSDWKPDPKLLSQLEPERSFDAYTMRIPRGFTVEEKEQTSEKGKVTFFMIKGAKRPDGTMPEMTVITGTIASAAYVAVSADALLNMNLGLDGKSSLVQSETEDGQIGDLEASRQYFKFAEKGHTIHGFGYATTDGHTNAQIIVGEQEPYSMTFLPLAETAARTLRKPD